MTAAVGPAAPRWRDELAAWQIPQAILDAAPESPYGHLPARFAADPEPVESVSRDVALAVLRPGDEVLDVGCGGGRAGLALAPPAGRVTGADTSPTMLAAFAAAADERGIAHAEVLGAWPAAAAAVAPADVVVCHHVIYNVAELGELAGALTARARRRVVLEATAVHPWVPTNDLWELFHGLARPAGPSVDLAAAVLHELGLPVTVERWSRPGRPADRAETVALVRRRLCLPASRDVAVDAALPTGYDIAPREFATLWWDTA